MNQNNTKILEDYQIELPERFISYLKDYLEDTDLKDSNELEEYIQGYNEKESDILFNDSLGQYIPKHFADLLLSDYHYDDDTNSFSIFNSYKNPIATWTGINKDDLILLSDSENLNYDVCDHYWDTWNDVLMMASLQYEDKSWTLDQDGDLWIKSEHYIYLDI